MNGKGYVLISKSIMSYVTCIERHMSHQRSKQCCHLRLGVATIEIDAISMIASCRCHRDRSWKGFW